MSSDYYGSVAGEIADAGAAPFMADRITVALIEKADQALDHLRALNRGLSKTDIVNRALQLADTVETQIAAGNQILIRYPDGSTDRMLLL